MLVATARVPGATTDELHVDGLIKGRVRPAHLLVEEFLLRIFLFLVRAHLFAGRAARKLALLDVSVLAQKCPSPAL